MAVLAHTAGRLRLVTAAAALAALVAAAVAPAAVDIGPSPIGPPVEIPPGTNASLVVDRVYRLAPNESASCPQMLVVTGPQPTQYDANGTTFAIPPSAIVMDGVACTGPEGGGLLAHFNQGLSDQTLKYQNMLDLQYYQRRWPGVLYAVVDKPPLKCGKFEYTEFWTSFMYVVDRGVPMMSFGPAQCLLVLE
eukprot:contig_5015_g1100